MRLCDFTILNFVFYAPATLLTYQLLSYIIYTIKNIHATRYLTVYFMMEVCNVFKIFACYSKKFTPHLYDSSDGIRITSPGKIF